MFALKVVNKLSVNSFRSVAALNSARGVECALNHPFLGRSFHASPMQFKEDEAKAEEAKPAEASLPEIATAEQQEIVRLKEELAATKDKWIRAVADSTNQYQIAKRDIDNAKQFALQKFSKSLLTVADNLNLALNNVKPETLESNNDLKLLYDGVKMTDTELTKVFQSFNIQKYGKVGDKFDPHVHEAMMQFEAPDKEPGSIGLVMVEGYMLHDRVLRPAKVGYVKAASEAPSNPTA